MSEQTIPLTLKEIHRLRRHIRDLQGEIDRGPRVLKAHQTKVAKAEEALKALQDQIKAAKVQLNDREVSIKTANQLLAKYEKQLNELTVPKQIEATEHEIAHSQGARQQLEEQSLELMVQIENLTAKLPATEKTLATAQSELKVYQAEAGERLDRMKQEIARAEGELKTVEMTIPDLIRPQFDRLIKAYGADALAGIEAGACQQCHSTITVQMMSELAMGKFVTCKSCARGLYLVK
jgi:predicted  nucleic acid-binding Zn-ribbon protein